MSRKNPRPANGLGTKHFVAAGLLVAVGALLTRDAWSDLFRMAARDPESGHVFLVPVIGAWLVWVRRGRFRQCRARGRLVGPPLIGLGFSLYLLGTAHRLESFWHAGAVLTAMGCFLSVFGSMVLRRFLPAFVALAFLVPVPGIVRQALASPLNAATLFVTEEVLGLLRLPDVHSLTQGSGTALSGRGTGLLMLFSLALVSFSFALGAPLRNPVRLAILASIPLTVIVCNAVRLLLTEWLEVHGLLAGTGGVHAASGWVMLPAAILLLEGIMRFLRWAMVPVTRYTLAYDY